ncbi:Putative ribonuclease H protein [Arachis hypogaea]|nr:Putative ribonuclease H protein [Arachis hypogaea]
MNEVLMCKIFWKLINEQDELWIDVLYSKYRRDKNLLNEFSVTATDSLLWKDLAKSWEQFRQHIAFNVENGESINFWGDKWMRNCPLLEERVIASLCNEKRNCRVVNYVKSDGD